MIVTLSGVSATVPERWLKYTNEQRHCVEALVASLVRSGADAVQIYRIFRHPRGGWGLSYSYTTPALKGARRLVGKP